MAVKLAIVVRLLIISTIIGAFGSQVLAQNQTAAQTRDIPVEVFAVLELPLSVQEAKLVKSDKGYLFRCQLANSSDSQLVGLRYSLVVADDNESSRLVLNRSEGFKLRPYSTKRITFQTPLRIAVREGQRVVLMLEQAISTDSIWEVVKAKDALAAYLKGDYSVVPTVVRTANQVDAPLPTRVIYRD